MNDMKPLVSIVIPAYNSAAFIRDALDSCLAQTYPHTEIIVVDDGSTDNTCDIVRSYGERIRLVQQPNSGPAIARNTGVAHAQGDYIQFCDSDDYLLPEKIGRCLPLLLDDATVGLAFCQMQPMDENGNTMLDAAPVPDASYFSADNLFCKLLYANGSPIQTSTWLVRKSALLDVGAYRDDPDHYCAEDWDLLLRLASHYRFAGVPEVLVHYRQRTGALTTDPLLMARGRLATVRYARSYPPRSACLSDDAYDALEASRYHVLARTLWQQGDNAAARIAFRQAATLHPPHARIRHLYAWLTYIAPASIMDTLNALLK